MKRLFVLAALAPLALACAPKAAPSYRALLRIQGDPGRPIAGANISYKDKSIGITNSEGVVELKLKGRDGQVFDLVVTCPNGYQSPPKPIPITIRRLAEPDAMPEYHASCPPLLRNVVVAVRAVNGPGLPVVFLGKERTRTDASGAAHLLLQVPPNQSIQLALDTSGSERLRPKSPAATFEVRNDDEVFVLEQKFSEERPRVARGGWRRSGGPTRL